MVVLEGKEKIKGGNVKEAEGCQGLMAGLVQKGIMNWYVNSRWWWIVISMLY